MTDNSIVPVIRNPNLLEKILAFPGIFKTRILNIFFSYPEFFRPDLGRHQDYLDAMALIRRHPLWLLQWKPDIPQRNSAEKIAFSMIRGPIWRYEAQDVLEYIRRKPRPAEKHPKEEVGAKQEEVLARYRSRNPQGEK